MAVHLDSHPNIIYDINSYSSNIASGIIKAFWFIVFWDVSNILVTNQTLDAIVFVIEHLLIKFSVPI